jgi:hypothetical protein
MGFLGSSYRADTAGQNFGGQISEQQKMLGQAQHGQLSLAQALQGQAAGAGPNAAMGMLQKGSEEAIKRSAGALASQRGINPALAQRLASQQAAEQGQQAAQAGAIMQAQQSQQALGQLGNVYGQLGGQAIQGQDVVQRALAQQNTVNAGIEVANAGITGSAIGGALQGAGAYLGLGKAHGGVIEGKAKVEGDHEANDTVPAMLSPGEIVIPRTKSGNADKAKEFIDHLANTKQIQGEGSEESKEVTYADVLAMQKQLAQMIKKLG